MVTPLPLVLFVVGQHPERGARLEAQHHHQANAARHLRSLGQPQPRRSGPSRGLRALRVSVLGVAVLSRSSCGVPGIYHAFFSFAVVRGFRVFFFFFRVSPVVPGVLLFIPACVPSVSPA